MIRLTCVIVLVLAPFSSFAQMDGDHFFPGKHVTLRTNPFSFLQREAGVMIGVNYRWHHRWSATIDPKFIFYSIQPAATSNVPGKPLGIRVKTDIRYHIKNFIGGFENIYVSPEVVFGYVRTNSTTEFGMNCSGQNCAYYMEQEYTEIKKEAGAAIKIGMIGPIRKNNERWKLEFYSGLGVSFFDFKYEGIPAGGEFMTIPVHEVGLRTVNEDGPNLMIPFGLIITYRIK